MTRKSVYALFLGVAVVAGGCQKKDAAPSPATSPAATMSEDEKAVYALGAAIGQQVAQQVKALNLTPAEVETLKKAFAASLAGQKPEYEIAQYGPEAAGAGRGGTPRPPPPPRRASPPPSATPRRRRRAR